MADKKDTEKEPELFLIVVTNKLGHKAFFGHHPQQGDVFTNVICEYTRFFYHYEEAKRVSNKYSKQGTVNIVKKSVMLENAHLYGLKTIDELDEKEIYFIVGTSSDGAKFWIHHDVVKKIYYPRNQMQGACGFLKNQTQMIIELLQKEYKPSQMTFKTEKVQDEKPKNNERPETAQA